MFKPLFAKRLPFGFPFEATKAWLFQLAAPNSATAVTATTRPPTGLAFSSQCPGHTQNTEQSACPWVSLSGGCPPQFFGRNKMKSKGYTRLAKRHGTLFANPPLLTQVPNHPPNAIHREETQDHTLIKRFACFLLESLLHNLLLVSH